MSENNINQDELTIIDVDETGNAIRPETVSSGSNVGITASLAGLDTTNTEITYSIIRDEIIFSNKDSFAAINEDGGVLSWGNLPSIFEGFDDPFPYNYFELTKPYFRQNLQL